MQLRQILTGSCNLNEQCLSVGTIYSYTFITYGSGSDLVILNHDFVRQQIIPGCKNNNSQIVSVSCTLITGKISVLYDNNIHIYEPHCDISYETKIGIDKYVWDLHSAIQLDKNNIRNLCWIPSFSDTIILVGHCLQVWQYSKASKFYVADEQVIENKWCCIWSKLNPGNAVIDAIKFSSDGKYFATLTLNSKDILIWFWDQYSYSYFNQNVEFNRSNDLLDFIILKHPSSIISFEWRSISNFVPKNSINNSLLTCSTDNVCRIWSESHLNQYKKFSNSSDTSMINNNDNKIPEHIKKIFLNYVKQKEINSSSELIIPINDDYLFLIKDPSYVYTYPEFVLSASINDSTDIPLFTTINSGKYKECKLPFVVHWLNNKDFNLNYEIEQYLSYFTKNLTTNPLEDFMDEDLLNNLAQFNRFVLLALNKWKNSPDVLFSIHPRNGSLLAWFIHNLDDSGGHLCDNKSFIIDKSIHIKNSQITFHSCLPNSIPVADAISMNSNILLYCEGVQSKTFDEQFHGTHYEFINNYDVKMISKQHNGSLNMWSLAVSNEECGNSSFLNIKHLSRISGHRWQTNSAACHINLPLLLTVSNFNKKSEKQSRELSELILWRIKPIGPFSKTGGITEIARINSENYLNFTKVAWFPGTVPTYFFGIEMSSPASFFIATDSQNNLSLYISIADAKNIPENNTFKANTKLNSTFHEIGSFFEIISITSTGEPGCILTAGIIEKNLTLKSENQKKTVLLHVFPKEMIINNSDFINEIKFPEKNLQSQLKQKYSETYFIVRMTKSDFSSSETSNQSFLEMWQIQIIDADKKTKSKTLNDLIKLQIICQKVYNNILVLPPNVEILKAVPAASHLSSASIYPSCLAPYLISTMCSDGSIRFWKCFATLIESDFNFKWVQWEMQLQQEHSSAIFLKNSNSIIEISCAYSGRVAVAYYNNNYVNNNSIIKETANVFIDIYECESTGGSEWILEDSITFPKNQLESNNLELTDIIQIDWVNSEDGTHLLSIALGTKIIIFTPACLEICKYSRFTSETSSLSNFTHWMKVNEIKLKTADSLPPIPEHISWAREGLLIVGLDNEVHVYNQWHSFINRLDNSCNEDREILAMKVNNKDLNDLIKKNPKANYSLARLKDAYFLNENLKKSPSKTHLKNINFEDSFDFSDEILRNTGLFEAAQIHNPVLPQYHPKQLMEWINFGKIQRVKAILSHLTTCISNDYSLSPIGSKYKDISKTSKFDENVFENGQLEIKAIPPLPLHVLLDIDLEVQKKYFKKIDVVDNVCDISDTNFIEYEFKKEDNLDNFETNSFTKTEDMPWIFSANINILSIFGPEQALRLSDCLTRVQLPGLSALDQIYLLGIAELMCNLKNDFSDQTIISKNVIKEQKESINNYSDQLISTNSMDDCGLRFLLAMQHFSYMTRTLPLNQRNSLMIQGIDTSCIIWGFHSETEEELCSRLDDITSHNITWVDFRRYGCGWWIRNNHILQRTIEKVAKNAFQKSKNPMDSAIFYLAIGKQKLIAKLFKNCNQTALFNFFNMNFSIEENKDRALNQAYKMRSKRRYDHAVALFLLCHSIDDAILICLHNLKDMQLAITISRLYDMNFNRNSKNLFSIIQNYVIHSIDPFIRSMGYWMLEDYGNSLDSLLFETPNILNNSDTIEITTDLFNSADTIVFVFYNFLKKHPIILRQKMIYKNNTGQSLNKDTCISPMERRLYFRTAYTYLKMGCPDLALEVLSKLPERIFTSCDTEYTLNSKKNETPEIIKDLFMLSFDFTPVNDPSFSNQWEEKDNDCEIKAQDNFVADKSNSTLDIMCLQYKFMICLKLISEELCTLATGIESHGSYLRYYLYTWLEKEVQVLQRLCGHSHHQHESEFGKSEFKLSFTGRLLFTNDDNKISIKDRIKLRNLWLKENQSLILSLYSFCSLHGPNIVGLAAIRMELLILIHELQGNSCIQFDTFKHPQSSLNLPFINSSISPDNGLIITPIQQLKAFILEIVDCLNSFKCSFSFLHHHSKQCQEESSCEISENKGKIKLLRNQCQALSACLHQCLSNFTGIQNDEDGINYNNIKRPRQSSTSVIYTAESDIHLRSKYLSETSVLDNISPNSDPIKWPGYTNLFKTIGCKPRNDITSFSHILSEALVVSYIGILLYALHLNDTNLLYRLTIVKFNKILWGKIFGGTYRLKPDRPSGPPSNVFNNNKDLPKILKESQGQLIPQVSSIVTDNRINSRLSQLNNSNNINDEKFIPPLYPILTSLLEKPTIDSKSQEFIYDSDLEDLDFNQYSFEETEDNINDSECANSKSYTWALIRLIILYTAHMEIKNLINMLQIETGELAIFCPNIFSITNCLVRWQKQCKLILNDFTSLPDSYSSLFNNCDKFDKSSKNDHVSARLINMCKALDDKENTPFKSTSSISLAMKRLWINLIKRSDLQPIFIQQFLNSMKFEKDLNADKKVDGSQISHFSDIMNSRSMSIIHKEHDSLYSMAINQIEKSLIVTCTSKEIIELNINNNPEKWFEDDYEYLLNTIKEPEKSTKSSIRTTDRGSSHDFLLVSPTFGSPINYSTQNCTDSSNVILKRQINGVQILKSHPTLPYYLTGNSNGQVGVFEWGIDAAIVKTYSPIQKGKITSLNFDTNGNKFGMGDSEGNFSMYHFSYADNSRAQYFQTRCPHKGVLDFCFLNSSSIVATCGGSALYGLTSVNHLHAVSGGVSNFDSSSINISIWDVLLPPGRNQVRNISDGQLASGVVTMCYASRYELLIVGTRKGEIAIIDIRQNSIQNIFIAHHDSCVTSIKLDPLQYFFISAASDGHIKIWRLYDQELLEHFRNDPIKTSVFSKGDVAIKSLNIIDDNKLISCSGDGFIKLRYIDTKCVCNNAKNDIVIL